MTTAWARYALLESTGDYHRAAGAGPVEVVVRFGEASLILMGFDDVPIAHWALASLRRLPQPGEPGALRVTPDDEDDPQGGECLVIRDRDMIEAIMAVCDDLDRKPPPDTRLLRIGAWILALALLVGAAVWVLPGQTERLVSLVSVDQERRIGENLMTRRLARLSPSAASGQEGPRLCSGPEGDAALAALLDRLTGSMDPGRLPLAPISVIVVEAPAPALISAPGGRMAVTSGLLELADSPDELAALLAHQIGHAWRRDGLRALLREASLPDAVTLALGQAPEMDPTPDPVFPPQSEAAAAAYAAEMLDSAGLPPSALGALARRLQAARAGAGGEGASLLRHVQGAAAPDGGSSAGSATRPAPGVSAWTPALEDGVWIALREICAE